MIYPLVDMTHMIGPNQTQNKAMVLMIILCIVCDLI